VAAAVGALHGARAAGIAIPDDVSVAAIHDSQLAANLYPTLTTVKMPLAAMGHIGVLALLGDASASSDRIVVREPTELIVRASTSAPPPRRRR
jgi:LacI family transcriptional regulator